MDIQQSVWIVGHGMLISHHQFCVDVPRLPEAWINGRRLPRDMYDALLMLYEECDMHYYQYTKYLNQTMGNLSMDYVHRVFDGMCIVPDSTSYSVTATCTDRARNIKSKIVALVYDNCTMFYARSLRIECTYDIQGDSIVVRVSCA